jgi:hypothetical protein
MTAGRARRRTVYQGPVDDVLLLSSDVFQITLLINSDCAAKTLGRALLGPHPIPDGLSHRVAERPDRACAGSQIGRSLVSDRVTFSHPESAGASHSGSMPAAPLVI